MRTRSLLLALPLFLAACSGSSDPATLIIQGDTAFAANDREGAVEKYEAALEHLDSSEDGYLQAKLGAIRAAASITPQRASDDFAALVEEKGDEIGAKEYAYVIESLSDAEEGLVAATALMAEAQGKVPGSKGLADLLTKIGDKTVAGGDVDNEIRKKLAGRGYVTD